MPSVADLDAVAEGQKIRDDPFYGDRTMSPEEIRQSEWYQSLKADRQSLTELGYQIVELAGHINAAHYRFLMLIAEWDHRKGWCDGASQSCAHWLNWKCGIDLGAAREKVRTAHTLTSLPKMAAAMQRGELSYAKARALTRVACPRTEHTLLQYALHGTAAHVERIVRDFRHCKEAEELGREAQQQASRELKWFYDADGMLVIKARLPAEAGQIFIKAIEAAKDEVFGPQVSAKTAAEISAEAPNVKSRPASPTRKADALTVMAESFLAQGAGALKGWSRHMNSKTCISIVTRRRRVGMANPATTRWQPKPCYITGAAGRPE